MKIRVYINNESQILELFNVCYEVQPDRFKSLRLSHGHYPDNVMLDYEDQEVEIRDDFIVDPEDLKSELKEHRRFLKTEVVNDIQVLKENWFCWKKGTPVSDIQ